MKNIKITIVLYCSLFTFHSSLSQTITADTISANAYFKTAQDYLNTYELDSALFYSEKAQGLYIKQLGENSIKNANVLHFLGTIYYYGGLLDESLNYYFKSLNIRLSLLGENNPFVARSYFNIGFLYYDKGEFDKALEYHQKALNIRLQIFGENHPDVAQSFNNIGNAYKDKSEYEKAFEYHQKALSIRLVLFGEKSTAVAESYINIGNVYKEKALYDKALEYYFMSLDIFMEFLGEKNPNVAGLYNNIGLVYQSKNEYDKALDYFQKSLAIKLELYGEKHPDVIGTYNNIGVLYGQKNEFNNGLDYFQKALKIQLELFGENNAGTATCYLNIGNSLREKKDYDNVLDYLFKGLKILTDLNGEKQPNVAMFYNNIGALYNETNENEKALEYHFKSLGIRLDLFGEKNRDVAMSYINIGLIYEQLGDYDKALKYDQKTVASCLWNFNDTTNLNSISQIENYLDWYYLLEGLKAKAKILADTSLALLTASNRERLDYALNHYLACDTLINKVRREISTQSDKIALGEKASIIYKSAAELCETLINVSDNSADIRKYESMSFYFSERNKSTVLLEALAGAEALKFSGIPDSLLQKEHDLNTSIANYSSLKNNAENDSISTIWKNQLFDTNRSYDSLIAVIETKYPKYYQLKYNNKPITINEIQNIIDKKTAILDYFVLDNSLMIYAITKKGSDSYKVPVNDEFEDHLSEFRTAIQTGTEDAVKQYKTLAFELYKQLFPKELTESNSFKRIKTLIIIPDGYLASIPFEALLTENYSPVLEDWKNTAYFSEMPFILNKYVISYSYSATLFHNTFPKTKSDQIEFSDLNDWLAFAPVFDNNGTAGTNAVTRKLLSEIEQSDFNNSDQKRTFLRDGTYISPLPGTLDEVNEIFKLYDNTGKKAKIYTHNKAEESILNSDELKKYRILHFATHGFVNIEKPELSGILTAQDTSVNINNYEDIYGNIAQQNDGIWYQSEIYNTKLNADLVVLSACETGLGKQVKGEGVIGLTRALLYAGAKNIIVSLWQVSDESTKQLMIEFYKNLLTEKSKKNTGYSNHLQKAKLKLIKEGKYAHPFFWSPFILIGK